MKETIYTIPVSEAYEKDCECPLCELERNLENEAVEYALGAAMMEPDFRINSNDKGYCRRHFTKMFYSGSKLPLALVLDTHLEETEKKIRHFEKSAEKIKSEKKGVFKKSPAADVADEISKLLENSCIGSLVNKDLSQTCNDLTVGCETLDRDYADYHKYKEYLEPLGLRKIRLQAGWAKTEKSKGKYDFAWLDKAAALAAKYDLKVIMCTSTATPPVWLSRKRRLQ